MRMYLDEYDIQRMLYDQQLISEETEIISINFKSGDVIEVVFQRAQGTSMRDKRNAGMNIRKAGVIQPIRLEDIPPVVQETPVSIDKTPSRKFKSWSKKEIEYLKKYNEFLSVEELASALGRTVGAVRTAVSRFINGRGTRNKGRSKGNYARNTARLVRAKEIREQNGMTTEAMRILSPEMRKKWMSWSLKQANYELKKEEEKA